MHRLASTILMLLLVACSDDDGRSTSDAVGCAPGLQVSCACPGGGMDGVQICSADGLGYGACVGCGEDSGGVTTSSGDGVDASTSTTPMDSAASEGGDVTSLPDGSEGAGPETSAGSEGGVSSESGDVLFAWVWADHGGPGFQPHPCAATAGVVDGQLVDPTAFFDELIQGTDADDWVAVLNAVEPELWACGLGQQRDSQGNVRGRLFLPTADCPDAAPPPDDAEAKFLGVRQEEACWAHPVDVVQEL